MATLESVPADLYSYFGIDCLVKLSKTSVQLYSNFREWSEPIRRFKKRLDSCESYSELVSLLNEYNNSEKILDFIFTQYKGRSIHLVKRYLSTTLITKPNPERVIKKYGFDKDSTFSTLLEDSSRHLYHNKFGCFFWCTSYLNFDAIRRNLPIELYIGYIDRYVKDKTLMYFDSDEWEESIVQSKLEKVLDEVVDRLAQLYKGPASERKSLDQYFSGILMYHHFETERHRLKNWYHDVGTKAPFCKSLWCILTAKERDQYELNYRNCEIEYKISEVEQVDVSKFKSVKDLIQCQNLTRDQGLAVANMMESATSVVYFEDAMPNIFVPYVWAALSHKEKLRYQNHLNHKFRVKLASKIEKAKSCGKKEIVLHTLKRIKISYSVKDDTLLYYPIDTTESPDDYFGFWLNKLTTSKSPEKIYSLLPPVK